MKKVLFLILGLVITLSINAQVKIVSPHPDIKVKFLRCIESGGTAVLEFTINNISDQDQKFTISGYSNYSTSYDDEGNVYRGGNIQISDQNYHAVSIVFPSNIPVKCRQHIEKVSQYSTEFSKATVGINFGKGYKQIEFFKVPITRD